MLRSRQRRAKVDEAMRLYRHGQALYERGALQSQPLVPDLSSMLTGSSPASHLREAMAAFEQALPIFRDAKETGAEATILQRLGDIYEALGQPQRALESFERGLPLARRAGWREAEGVILARLGGLYDELARPREAFEHYAQALPILRELVLDAAEASTLHGLGRVSMTLARPQEAIGHLERALALVQKGGVQAQAATVMNSLAGVYRNLGRPQEALEYLRQALPIAREARQRGGEAIILNDLGAVYNSLGRPQEALEHFERALPIIREMGQRVVEGAILNGIGRACDDLGQPGEALEHFKQALATRREAGDRVGEAASLHALGNLYKRLARPEEALEHLGQALPIAREIQNRGAEGLVLGDLGAVHHDLEQGEEARRYLEQAIQVVEEIRGELLSEELRTSYFATVGGVYAAYVSLLVEQGERERAFHAAERARARAFLDLLAEAQGEVRQGADPELREEEQRLLFELSAQRKRLVEARSRPQEEQDEELSSELERAIREGELRLHTLEARIRAENPRYAALTQPTAWGLPEIQEQLLDERTALLEYVLAEGASLLFCVLEDDFEVFTLPPKEEIEGKVRELRAAVLHGLPRYPHGEELYRDLIAPAANLIRGKDLLICADGALHYLPFSLLLTASPEEGEGGPEVEPPGGRLRAVAGDEEEQALLQKVEADLSSLPAFDYKRLPYLIREHAISYAPSATVAGMVRAEAQEKNRSYDAELAAFADPRGLGAEEESEAPAGPSEELPVELGAALAHTRDTLEPIPATADEVWTLAELLAGGALPQEHPERFDEGPIVLRTAAAATKEEMEQLTSGERAFRFVHIATHGLLDPEKPQFSGLVFTAADGADPFWRTFEIFNARIPSELVVLSACETGLGRIVSGEGIVGLTRAFLYAGAPSVCVSLWKVAEESSPQLMKSFYRRILAGESKAKALQGAQLELLEESPYAHPFWWGPFVLVGEG